VAPTIPSKFAPLTLHVLITPSIVVEIPPVGVPPSGVKVSFIGPIFLGQAVGARKRDHACSISGLSTLGGKCRRFCRMETPPEYQDDVPEGATLQELADSYDAGISTIRRHTRAA
jgi:hypothetical protein